MKAKRKLKQNLPNLSPKKEALSQIAKIEIPIKDELLTSVESDDEYSQKIVENIAEKESSERTEIKFDSSRANKEDLEMINEYLENSDLRYNSELRADIYRKFDEDPNQTYYQMALKHGLDLARLY